MKAVKYLIEQDKELADILLARHPDVLSFIQKTKDEKIEFIRSVLTRCEVILDSSPHLVNAGWMEIEEGDMNTLGTSYNYFVMLINILNSNTYSEFMGWHNKHGNCYAYFENMGDNNIYVSLFSDGHPENKFKMMYIPFKTNIDKLRELQQLPVTGKNITSISESVKTFLLPDKNN